MEMLGIGEKLRNLRTCKKLSLKQVSERLGISVSALSAYELNEKNPSYKNLLKLARLYSVSCDYLIGNTENRTLDVSGLRVVKLILLPKSFRFSKKTKNDYSVMIVLSINRQFTIK